MLAKSFDAPCSRFCEFDVSARAKFVSLLKTMLCYLQNIELEWRKLEFSMNEIG